MQGGGQGPRCQPPFPQMPLSKPRFQESLSAPRRGKFCRSARDCGWALAPRKPKPTRRKRPEINFRRFRTDKVEQFPQFKVFGLFLNCRQEPLQLVRRETLPIQLLQANIGVVSLLNPYVATPSPSPGLVTRLLGAICFWGFVRPCVGSWK